MNMQIKTIHKALWSDKATYIILAIMGISCLISDIMNFKSYVFLLQLFGWTICCALCAALLYIDVNMSKLIHKTIWLSLMWFCSCVILFDFSDFNMEKVAELLTAWMYIFLGCILPDVIIEIKKKDEGNPEIEELKKRIEALENSK